ncbi:MAG: cytochrome c biogenesis protein CcdA [Helicobacter sp.]|nr:cytochrome c biogenesis protein CcdA [Helicobacter sp.]
MEVFLFSFFDNTPLLISFLAGILTFLSPCVLPLIPAYLSYISGISLQNLKDSKTLTLKQRVRILFSAAFFVLGLGVVFILIGAVAARILSGGILLSPFVRYIAGGILILFGFHILGFFKIPFLNYQASLKLESKFTFLRDFFTPFLLGVSFALGWTPCVGPILAAIISLASLDSANGILLLCLFTLGLSIPFLLSALLITYAFGALESLKKHLRVIEIISGSLLILIGFLVLSGGMGYISQFLVESLK